MGAALGIKPSPLEGEGYEALLAQPARRSWMRGKCANRPLTQLRLGTLRAPSLRNPLPLGGEGLAGEPS